MMDPVFYTSLNPSPSLPRTFPPPNDISVKRSLDEHGEDEAEGADRPKKLKRGAKACTAVRHSRSWCLFCGWKMLILRDAVSQGEPESVDIRTLWLTPSCHRLR